MHTDTLLSIPLHLKNSQEILKKIENNFSKEKKFLHIVTLNPEILIIAQKNEAFRKILSESDIQICDGIGISLACRFLQLHCPERITGVDLMEMILQNFHGRSLSVLLIGGKDGLADTLAKRYQQEYPISMFFGLEGYEDVNNPSRHEEESVLRILSEKKPDVVFVAFGAPMQELWIDRHRAQLSGSACMGVGGSFDYLAGKIPRAPGFVRMIGMEWLFRLIVQPWRFFRQLRLVQFVYLVVLQKMSIRG